MTTNDVEQRAARRREIAQQIKRLNRTIEELRQEDLELAVLERLDALEGIRSARQQKAVRKLIADTRKPVNTIAEMVLRLLAEQPNGMRARDLLYEIQDRWRPDITYGTLATNLSRMKGQQLTKNGMIWLTLDMDPEDQSD